MTRQLSILAAALMLLGGAGLARAADTKEMTLKGTLECSKCELHDTADCGTVLSVKEGNKDVIYYLVDNDLAKTDHKKICTKPTKDVSVTGTVEDKSGKMWLTASKIEFPK